MLLNRIKEYMKVDWFTWFKGHNFVLMNKKLENWSFCNRQLIFDIIQGLPIHKNYQLADEYVQSMGNHTENTKKDWKRLNMIVQYLIRMDMELKEPRKRGRGFTRLHLFLSWKKNEKLIKGLRKIENYWKPSETSTE